VRHPALELRVGKVELGNSLLPRGPDGGAAIILLLTYILFFL
jgi:hypothetical protein